jgi:hypothetical protein
MTDRRVPGFTNAEVQEYFCGVSGCDKRAISMTAPLCPDHQVALVPVPLVEALDRFAGDVAARRSRRDRPTRDSDG